MTRRLLACLLGAAIGHLLAWSERRWRWWLHLRYRAYWRLQVYWLAWRWRRRR